MRVEESQGGGYVRCTNELKSQSSHLRTILMTLWLFYNIVIHPRSSRMKSLYNYIISESYQCEL